MTTKTGAASTLSPTTITAATAVLLLRDDRRAGGNTPHASLTATVQRARIQRPPHPRYRLELTGHGTHMVLTTTDNGADQQQQRVGGGVCTTGRQYRPNAANVLMNKQTSQQDEGFESDIDSLSIVSSDSINNQAGGGGACAVVATETDSANGSSACSDDSDDNSSSDKTVTGSVCAAAATAATTTTIKRRYTHTTESYNLVSVLCYTDVTCPDLLVVLIDAGDTFVFRFTAAGQLTSFYASFTALKAVSQQRHYCGAVGTAKFNLLHRTDTNGVTHIEIARDRIAKWANYDGKTIEPSSIISLDTPGYTQTAGKYLGRTYESRQRSLSSENILDFDLESTQCYSLSFGNTPGDKSLRKVWNSVENLLDGAPIKPERRKRVKQRAPQPPVPPPPPSTALTIQSTKAAAVKSNNSASRNMRIQFQNLFGTAKGGSTGKAAQLYQPFKYSEYPKRPEHPAPARNNIQYINPWHSTVPRLLRSAPPKQPKVEANTFIRHLSAAAAAAVSIRYVQQQHPKAALVSPITPKQTGPISNNNSSSIISNRLFGMSGKLKDFTSVQCGATTMPRKGTTTTSAGGSRWNSLGELTTATYSGNLKSVIKKEDQTKKSKEKKVTFSDFTTVKVL